MGQGIIIVDFNLLKQEKKSEVAINFINLLNMYNFLKGITIINYYLFKAHLLLN